MKSNSMYKLPTLIAFFTGLRSTEIKYLLERWDELKKIEIHDYVMLVELNYDRGKKKAYITLMPTQLAEQIKRMKLSSNWKDAVRYKYGVRLGLFRKAWIAITAKHLDAAERDLLQGRLKSVQVRHYIKHIRDIAKRYAEAFEKYQQEILSPSSASILETRNT
jgi:intergrase/recombinase